MTTVDIIRILELEPAGALDTIDRDPLEENLKAENEYHRFFQETVRLEDPEGVPNSTIQRINLLYMKAEAWKELFFKRCMDCGSITLKEHKHCSRCRKVLDFKRQLGKGDVSIWKARCSCGHSGYDFREV